VALTTGGRTSLLHGAPDLAEYDLAEPELLSWQASEGDLIHGLVLQPKPLDPNRRYPVVVYVYGGPRAPTIRDAWGTGRGRELFHHYLAQQGYVVIQVDDRASSRLGHHYEAKLQREYGPVALKDYEAAVQQIRKMPFADPSRIAIWGWSGGGFSTCFAMTHSKLFKAGIAVAPVTDWRLYDSIYTERYMGRPQENEEAYERTSAVKAAAHLHGRLLLVHGTADDNVHIQNTMQFVDALVKAGKPYDLLVYPGKTHSIHGPEARLHLFRAMEEFLKKNL
jgi:dipeptidyl-peptidase-4